MAFWTGTAVPELEIKCCPMSIGLFDSKQYRCGGLGRKDPRIVYAA